MKVVKTNDNGSLMIVPETEFEKDELCRMYPQGETYPAFIKTEGTSVKDIVGLKIKRTKIEMEVQQ